MNQKDIRIVKLYEKGLDPPRIAKKLGYAGPNLMSGIARVMEGLVRAGIYKEEKRTYAN